MHSQDLEPENILLTNQSSTSSSEAFWEEPHNQLIKEIPQKGIQSLQASTEILRQSDELLADAFAHDAEIGKLLAARAHFIDQLLVSLWREFSSEDSQAVTLVAVGGYGREEMHPQSDVDLLILLSEEPSAECEEVLSGFITRLWDIKLDVGHSVRTFDECLEEAGKDLTVITNLIESRYLCGNRELFEMLKKGISPENTWDSSRFFQGKLGEQRIRYKRYGDTAYRVEPNLKDGPGGLRDIHMISWVSQREYGTLSLKELYENDLLNADEYNTLIQGRDFLWRVRFALHNLAKRKGDRLQIDQQRDLARQFGYTSDVGNRAVEDFMQHYYQTITVLGRLNDLLLGIFREKILGIPKATPINNKHNDKHWYENRGGYLALADKMIFSKHPYTMLEIFHIMQITPGLKGLTPSTLRLLNQHMYLIDDDYRADHQNKKIFINIMSESQHITFVLRRMNRYGVLAAWLPAFANIVGRMQFDLFHAYTVDEHTMRVISMIRRNTVAKGAAELPFCSLLFKSLPKPMLLYIAGLFHDIGKGRNGDHSKLGAVDAFDFCRALGLDLFDANLVSWLVRRHLLMSTTAQRKDLSDPEVIRAFADSIVSPTRLDYLYLLTIADIRGTNQDLWNGWKKSLLSELYGKTRKLLLYGRPPASYAELLEQKRNSILEKLPLHNISRERGEKYCQRMGDKYLLAHNVDTVLWHMLYIVNEHVFPLIQIRQDETTGVTQLFIYTPNQDGLFTRVTSALGQLRLNIVAAHILSTPGDYALDTLNLLDMNNQMITDPAEHLIIVKTLRDRLTAESLKEHHYHTPRQLQSFDTPTRVTFSHSEERKQTLMTVKAADKPGVLTRISEVFQQQNIHLISARITTLGEEVEDIFHITDQAGNLIPDKLQEEIRTAVVDALMT
jgi:[protein-PII] uridylyltransferase